MSQPNQLLITVAAVILGSAAALARNQAPKLVSPIYGEARIEVTAPVTKVVGNEVVTTLLVKNMEAAPIAGFQVEEYWYDAPGNPLGAVTYRHPRPLLPGEVITVTLKTRKDPKLNRNMCNFSQAHGPIKKTVVKKLDLPKPAK